MTTQCCYRRCRRFAKGTYCNELCVMGEDLALCGDDRKTAMSEGMLRALQQAINQ